MPQNMKPMRLVLSDSLPQDMKQIPIEIDGLDERIASIIVTEVLSNPLFEDNYVFIGAIATTSAPAISITTLVNTFPATTITPANTGTGVWTLTANVANTYKTTSLIICNRTYSQGTVELGYVRTSDTVLTITTRGVPGSASNLNANNMPLIVITPKA